MLLTTMKILCFRLDGLVKSPIYFVVGFLKLHDILHVWSRNFKKHYASYIKLFSEPSKNFEHTFYETVNINKLVKTSKRGWLSKKLHMRGVRFFYHFGVLEYVVMIEKSQQRSR